MSEQGEMTHSAQILACDDGSFDAYPDAEFDELESVADGESLEDKGLQVVERSYIVDEAHAGARLDKVAATVFADFSRVQLQDWIGDGKLTVNDKNEKPKYRVKIGDELTLNAQLASHSEDLPENIAIDVVYADADVLVINKPAGMVVHPGAGNRTGTLVNALLYHYPDNASLPRAGLVHRIDKDTTGLLVVARSKKAQLDLMAQLKDKSVYRHYQCVAVGAAVDILRQARIDLPIARHPTQRTKMAVREGGKPAVTHIIKAQALNDRYSLLDVRLETGRTHQIRVHLSHCGFALVGDPVYGTSVRSGLSQAQRLAVQGFSRQALHAHTLGFTHPATGEPLEFSVPLPADMQALIDALSE
ncbi:RNA pseudouridine synthase [Moraxella caviae]|uniref:Pseudouridine synthase n=1 Tax=Moraxella caviae TaxID=34060 RepID=A0A1T0A2R9_9GAMM|nr:RluA family pseudouridine synthase [Moraxella caviae]OOR90092.1 RNA pseudouridine synthase [Moraxella caviae]STZ14711.1 Ribosomal large subunit pseudouridine synthase D [Moraxella caviae]VEW11428.1 Ribosomal large subunit pseudouridine synthase D [Moraxella caviae]